MLPDVFALLATADVKAIVGSSPARIYRHGTAPQTVVAPYITWFLVSGTPENTLSEAPLVDQDSIQVNYWGKNDGRKASDDELDTLANAGRDAIEAEYYITSFGNDGLDDPTQRPRISQTFTIWKHR